MNTARTIAFHPFEETFLADPYPVYRRLLEAGPATWNTHEEPGWPGQWVFSGYEAARLAFREKLLSKDVVEARARGIDTGHHPGSPLWRMMERWATVRDAKEHSRLRQQVNKPFAAKSVDGFAPRISSICKDVVAALPDSGEAELVAELKQALK